MPTSLRQRLLTLLCVCSSLTALAATVPPEAPTEAPLLKANANPRLIQHSNFFGSKPTASAPAQPMVYNLRTQHWPLAQFPANLQYDAYSAVGFDLANTILLLGPPKQAGAEREWIIVDTLGSGGAVDKALPALKTQVYGSDQSKWPAKLPIRAIIYTHNHIDHTAGVNSFLKASKWKVCASELPANAGQDTYFNVDTQAVSNNEPCVAVIGQEKINSAIVNTATVVGSAIDPRSGYMYGSLVPLSHVNSGIGPSESSGTGEQGSFYYMPSRTFSKALNVTAAGLNLRLIYVPSETDDELAVFLADKYNGVGAQPTGTETDWNLGTGLLLSAEVIQGPSFPNLYSLRGTGYRDPANWYNSVDVLRSLGSWCMVPSHGPPLCDHANIELLLRSFRDAVQFSNDQALRYINQGYTLAELPGLIKLPDYLLTDLDQLKPIQNEGSATPFVNPRDYLTDFYGSVSQGVREVYVGKLGWFQADPIGLRPTPPQKAAQGMLALIPGGAPKLLEQLRPLLAQMIVMRPKDSPYRLETLQWIAELATIVIKAGVSNPNYPTDYKNMEQCKAGSDATALEARHMKAQALSQLAEVEINPNWRNWYATSARELECVLPLSEIRGGLVSSTIITALPASSWITSLGWRLKAEQTVAQNVNQSLGFFITNEPGAKNGNAGYVLTVRKAVAQFNETGSVVDVVKQASNVVLGMDRATFNALVLADGAHTLEQTLKDLVATRKITLLKGTAAQASAFLNWFDPKPVDIPVLSGR